MPVEIQQTRFQPFEEWAKDVDEAILALSQAAEIVIAGNPAYAQLEVHNAITFSANWTPISWDDAPLKQGISISPSTPTPDITFEQRGVYRITVMFRNDGGDVWTAMRFSDNDDPKTTRGQSAVSGSLPVTTATFLAEVPNTDVTYSIEIGKTSPGGVIGSPPIGSDKSQPPLLVATLEKIA